MHFRTSLLACAVLMAVTSFAGPALAAGGGPARAHAAGPGQALTWTMVPSPAPVSSGQGS